MLDDESWAWGKVRTRESEVRYVDERHQVQSSEKCWCGRSSDFRKGRTNAYADDWFKCCTLMEVVGARYLRQTWLDDVQDDDYTVVWKDALHGIEISISLYSSAVFPRFLICILTLCPVSILIYLRLNLSAVHNDLSLPLYCTITPSLPYPE